MCNKKSRKVVITISNYTNTFPAGKVEVCFKIKVSNRYVIGRVISPSIQSFGCCDVFIADNASSFQSFIKSLFPTDEVKFIGTRKTVNDFFSFSEKNTIYKTRLS